MRARRSVNNDNEIDMTPMLDVVFILLIFFIVTSSPDKTQDLEVVLPSAASSDTETKENFELQITKDEVFIHEGERYSKMEAYALILEQSSDFSDLVVYADKDLRTEVFVNLADYAKSHGYDSIALATKEGS